jgi:hypothetical protein
VKDAVTVTVTPERQAEVAAVLGATDCWVRTRSDIQAFGLAGSRASDEARTSSESTEWF